MPGVIQGLGAAVTPLTYGLAGMFPVESGYTRVFAVGGVGAALLLLTATLMPDRTLLLAPQPG
jgi:hypothetical protein